MRTLLLAGFLVAVMGVGCTGPLSPAASVEPSPAPAPAPVTPPTSEKPEKSVPKSVAVEIKDSAFSPQMIAINPGDTVVWTNKGKFDHTSTGLNGPLLWDSGNIKSGESYHRVFAAEGRYEYRCGIHPNMTGTVIVGKIIPSAP
ncbi:MAG: cupredoxin domain-containing protein [Candidatus Uhrbacteria bacterium]|nr:cupredoxin domain-containing protein [Candidatus Uhrbacteria bacterium]MDP3793774.1 cupredoxin domain-containing protein [Candidatus Uhrbacteria bacterium]